MNNSEAIENHRTALLRIVAGLFAFMAWVPGFDTAPVERITRPVYYAVQRLLLPAESALRRLIYVMAQGIEVKPKKTRSSSRSGRSSAKTENASDEGANVSGETEKKHKKRRRLFRLFDTFKRIPAKRPVRVIAPEPKARPRIWSVDPYDELRRHYANIFFPPPAPPPPLPSKVDDGLVSASPLYHRLAAAKGAIEDLNAQAKRLARWLARPVEERKPSRESPLRPDVTPGLPLQNTHEVHEILEDCDRLADRAALGANAGREAADTS